MVNFSLEGKVALVTGASYGIGFALATAFARQGAKIVFNDIKQELVDKGLAAYKAEGIEATDEEVEAEIAKFAEEGKKTVEEFKASLKPEDIDYLKDSIGIRKTVDMLKAAAAE